MEEQQPSTLAASFPAPPPFWQHFTPENLTRVSNLRSSQSQVPTKAGAAAELPVRILDLPPELRCLQPQEPPAGGVYRCFGDVYNMNDPLPSLEEQGIQQLYTPPDTPTGKHGDRALILKRIAKSLLLNFLELVGVMSANPEQYAEKILDLRTLFINFHHLLNEYRPHQARESLVLMMENQLRQSRAETQGIKDMKEKVEGILEGLAALKVTEPDAVDKTEGEAVPEGRDAWEMLEREFG